MPHFFLKNKCWSKFIDENLLWLAVEEHVVFIFSFSKLLYGYLLCFLHFVINFKLVAMFSTGLALGPTQPPIQWVRGAPFPGIKWPGNETGCSLPCSAEVKNMLLYTFTPPYVLMGWFLINKTQGQFYLLLSGAGITRGYRLDSPGLIPGSARFFSSP
jgi:hypothetical protein